MSPLECEVHKLPQVSHMCRLVMGKATYTVRVYLKAALGSQVWWLRPAIPAREASE